MTRNSFDLEVRDLTIEYVSGGYTVRPIHGLDLDGARGEIMLLLGASGCGKTTVLSVLAAILTRTPVGCGSTTSTSPACGAHR